MSKVIIHGATYNDVEVTFGKDNEPKDITFQIPKGSLDLDNVAADFSAGANTLTIDDVEYKGYVVFKSLAYDLDKIVILIAQKSVQEQLDDANAQIAELQDAVSEIIIGG